MKKIICVICVLLLLAMPVQAAEYDSVTSLWNDWSMNGAPDWFCSASSTDGTSEHMTFIVNSPEAETELLSMLPEDAALAVIVSTEAYSQAELLRIQEEITNTYMTDAQPPVAGVGIGWTTVDGEVTGFGESGREDRVVVSVLADQMDTVGAEIQAAYGEAVYLEAVDGYATPTAAEEAAAAEETAKDPTTIILWAAIAVMIVILLSTLAKRPRKTKSQDKEQNSEKND